MIPNDIVFLQPETLDEGVSAWTGAHEAGRRVRYFGGGTELVTGARERTGEFDVLIDLKRIPETTVWDPSEGNVGAATRLSRLADQTEMPLLAAAARGVADRTVRNSVTFGGNLCSILPYREVALPLLLFDGEIELYGPGGSRRVRAMEVFDKRMRLGPGEFVVSATLPEAARGGAGTAAAAGALNVDAGLFYARRTRDSRVDYPLVTLCAARVEGLIRVAVGGVYGYPVRSVEAEAAVNKIGGTPEHRAAVYIDALDKAVSCSTRDDMRASADYRRHLLTLTLTEALEALEVLEALDDQGGPA